MRQQAPRAKQHGLQHTSQSPRSKDKQSPIALTLQVKNYTDTNTNLKTPYLYTTLFIQNTLISVKLQDQYLKTYQLKFQNGGLLSFNIHLINILSEFYLSMILNISHRNTLSIWHRTFLCTYIRGMHKISKENSARNVKYKIHLWNLASTLAC